MLEPGVSIAPLVDISECHGLVREIFGLQVVKITELNGYDDRNYKLSARKPDDVDVQSYVLKILNALDSQKLHFIEAQNAMLLHLGDRGIVCPQPQKTTTGNYYAVQDLRSGKHVVRLMNFIKGSILHEVEGSWDLYYQAGQYIARVNNFLENFHHRAYDTHTSLWMLDSIPQLRQFLCTVPEKDKQRKFAEIITAFEKDVLQSASTLQRGMIHGDFNEQNVVVSLESGLWRIHGVLDFGDSHKGCYLYELAISMTYMMIVSKQLAMGGAVLQGYLKIRSISDMELGLLRICILARLTQSLVMGAYSAHLHPENSTYLLTTAVSGWKLFQEVYSRTNNDLLQIWRKSSTT